MSQIRPFSRIHPYYERLRHLRGAIILIEGVIGAGKTTLAGKLANLLTRVGIPVKFFEENVNTHLLGLFLADMKKYAFAFQLLMPAQRRNIYLQAMEFSRIHNGVSIIDRSLYGDLAFANMHHDMGNIDDAEWKAYESLMSNDPLPQPSVIIYLDVDTEVAMARIKARNRGTEANAYTSEYIQGLDGNYRCLLESSDIPTRYIDWTQPRNLSDEELLEIADEVVPEVSGPIFPDL